MHTKHLNDIQSAVTTTEFDFAGRPLNVTSPDGSVVSHSYYPDGLIKETIDALGYKTHFKYDSFDNLTQKWTQGEVIDGVAKFRYDKMVYDLNGHLTREIKSPAWVNAFEEPETPYTSGFTTGYTYLANGQLLSILEPQGKFTTHVYNLDGKLTRTTETIDANRDRITQMAYDAKGQVVSRTVTVEKGQLIGNSLEDTGPDHLEIKTEYDAMGRIVKEIAADGSVTEHSYDLLGRKTATWEQGIDENGLSALVKEAFTHTWDGKVKTHKDFKGNVTVYDYDSLGNCIKITGPLGDTKQFAYDKAGRLVREAQPAAYDASKAISEIDHVQYVYDLLGRLLEKRDQFTQRVWQPQTQTYAVSSVTVVSKAYQYNALGKITKEMDGEQYLVGKGTVMTYTPAGQVKSMLTAADADKGATATSINQYDALGRKLSEKNALGNILIYSYDADDNLTHTAFKATEGAAEVLLETKGYDYENRLKQVVDANGFVRSYTYTLLGQKQSETLPSDATLPALTLNYQYDRTGQMARSVDSLGREVLITYDHAGRVLTKALQNTDGTERLVHQYRYDLNGNLVKEINPANRAITKAYDALNRLVSESVTVKAPGLSDVVQTTSFTYDLNGNRLTETNWLGNSVQMVYDGKNRLVEKKDPSLNVVERHNYNRADASTESFDANGGKISFSYDANQRLLSTTDAEGLVTTQTYDLLGRVHTKVDGKGQITTHHYDAFGRLTDLTDALGLVTHFTYDLLGNLLVQTEAGGKTTTYQYGARGQVIKRFEHGGLVEGIEMPSRRTAFFYTADGKLAKETDRKGQDTLYTYDRHDRQLQKTMVGETVSFLYDVAGNVTTINDNTGITVRTFDSLGRLLTETAPLTGMVTYEHDLTTVAGVTLNAGEVATKTIDSKGDAVLHIFDSNRRLSRVVDMIGPMSTVSYLYDPVGNQREVLQSNGVKSVYTYDKNNQVVTLTTYKADSSVFEAFSYSYDSAKNQNSKTDRKGLTSYVYDALNRLKEVTEPSGKVTTYTFDTAGNRATEHVVLGEDEKRTTYLYNELNQLLEATTAKVDTIAPGIAITPAGKVFNGTVSVSITTPDPAASLYYTTNGSMPSETNGTLFTEAFNIGATTTLKAVAIDPAGNASEVKTEIYTLDNVAPDLMVSPVGKSFNSTLAVTLSSLDPTASIYYTINGTAPSAVNGTLYTAALNLTATTTLKAVAIDPVGNASAVTTEVYILDTIAPGIAISPSGKSFNGTLAVTLSSLDPTASIYYTTNGTTPSAVNGARYTAALNLTATTTVKAIAIDPAGNASVVVTEVYTFDNLAPGIAISPGGKSFNSTLSVTLSSADPTASIYYTTNGTTPSAVNGTRYTVAFNVGATTTVKAVAIDPAGNASAVATEVYTFDNVAPSVTISPGSRSFGSTFSVTLSSADGTASIYYTTNGTTPSAVNGTRYTAAFNISSTTTLKAIAIDPAGNASAVATASYTYDVCLASCQCTAQGCQTCQSTCQISCQTGCQVSCQSGCQVYCQSSCETSCQSGCQVSCQSGCQVSCQTSCQVSCLGCQTSNEMIQYSVPIDPEAEAMMTSDEDTKIVPKTKYSKASLFSAPSTFVTMNSPVVSNLLSKISYTYDESGNMLSEVTETYDPNTHALTETKTTTHTWDAGNRLIASSPDGRAMTYQYNALDNRVAKSVDGIITRYLYEGKHALLELSVNNVTLAKNIRGLTILKRNVSGKALSYVFNAHGDVTALIDKNGALSGRYDYDAFGNLLEEADGHGNPYKYAGYEQDVETGLYNLKARYYSPKVARFISEDTYRGERTNGLSLNLYTYCHNEPVRYVDPTGHSPNYSENGMERGDSDGINYLGLMYIGSLRQNAKSKEDKDAAQAGFEYYMAGIQLQHTTNISPLQKDNINKLSEAFEAKKPTNDFEASMDMIQGMIDVISMLPVLGAPADGLNALLYSMRGRFADAGTVVLCQEKGQLKLGNFIS